MLFNPAEIQKLLLESKKYYRAWVEENDDPMKLGRIKVQCRARWDIQDVEKLPWVFPWNGYGLGGSCITSGFSVPEKGSEVIIFFPFEDEYYPFYSGYIQSDLTHQAEIFDVSYPNTYGFMDSQCQWLRVNKEEGYTEWFHVCGMTFRLYDDGNIHWHVPKNLHITIDEDLLVKVRGKEVWEIDDTSSKKVGSDKVVHVGGDNSVKVTGDSKYETKGDLHRTVNGDTTHTYYGDVDRQIYGDWSDMIIGDFDEQIIMDMTTNVVMDKTTDVLMDHEINTFMGLYQSTMIETHEWCFLYKYSTILGWRYYVTDFDTHEINRLGNDYRKSWEHHRVGDVLISEDAPQIHHNSGMSVDPEEEEADDTIMSVPEVPDMADLAGALIGHGKLGEFIAALEAKVEELKALDETMKSIEEEKKEKRKEQ